MSSLSRAVLCCASASMLVAQPTPSPAESIALDHVVVSAHPYARSQSAIVQPTGILTGAPLFQRQASSLGELLTGQPGISSTWFGPGASRPIIRGLGGDRLRVLQNNLGTLDASVTSPDHAVALDPLLIERVEIVRGPASLLYGSSAVGGVVNVITHRIHSSLPPTALEGRAEVRHSDVNDEAAGGVVLEGSTGMIGWHVDAYRRSAGDVKIPGRAAAQELDAPSVDDDHEHHDDEDHHASEGDGYIPNTALSADGAAAGFSFIGSTGYVGFSVSGHNTVYGVPEGAHAHDHEEEDPAGEHDEAEAEEHSVVIDLKQRRVDAEGELRLDHSRIESVRVKLSRSEYRHQELEGEEIGTVFTNEGYEGRAELLHGDIAGFSGALGAQFSRQALAALGDEAFLPPNRTAQLAVFLFEETSTGPLTWQFGARAERQSVRLRDGTGANRSDTGFSTSGGVIWAFAPDWSLAVSANHTERPPNAQEQFANGPHMGTRTFERGDPALREERSNGLDISLRRRAGPVTGALTVFVNRFDDYIYAAAADETIDELPVYEYVQDDAEFTGAELETVWHLYDTEAQSLHLNATADLVRATNRADDTSLPRITPPRFRLGLDWTRGPFAAGAGVQRTFAQSRLAPDESATAAYTLVDAYVSWRFELRRALLEVMVRGSNLSDEEARVHTSFLKDVAPLPGRNVVLALRTSF